jgi:peptidase E
MNNPRPVLLLAGGGSHDPKNLVHAFERVFQECPAPKPRIAYLGVASKDNLFFYKAVKSLLKQAGAAEVTLLHLAKSGADVNAAKRVLESADAIFISGGEVEDGMCLLMQHGLVAFLKDLYCKGKLFFGMSAGSIMMGSHWVRWENPKDDASAELFDCLGLVPAIFDTHAEDEDWKELKTALQLMGPGARGYGIPSDGMISADSQGRLVNLAKALLCYINNNGQVQRESE